MRDDRQAAGRDRIRNWNGKGTSAEQRAVSAGIAGILDPGSVAGVKQHMGDMDAIPAMEGLTVDVLMVPVSGAYVADPAQAAAIARVTKASLALPRHFGTLFGTQAEAERFKELADCQVMLLGEE
jgi:L-ascorbate metabolism protein UlaG (beta-lactamase superfamily)